MLNESTLHQTRRLQSERDRSRAQAEVTGTLREWELSNRERGRRSSIEERDAAGRAFEELHRLVEEHRGRERREEGGDGERKGRAVADEIAEIRELMKLYQGQCIQHVIYPN